MTITKSLQSLDINFSPILYADALIFTVLTIFYLDQLGLEAGERYFKLVTIGAILILFGILLFKENDIWKSMFPVNINIDKDVLVYFLGIITPLLLFSFSLFTNFSFFNPQQSPLSIAPLAQFSTSSSLETFSAIKTAADPFTYGFIVVMGASRIEELILGFVFVMAGALGSLLFIMLFLGLQHQKFNITQLYREAIKHQTSLFVGGMILSIFFFIILHSFNNTYQGNYLLFFQAGVFRLIMNILIYKFLALGLMFSIGFHMIWNLISIGSTAAFSFLFSFGGLLIILYHILLFSFMITRISFSFKEFIKIITFRSRMF